MAGAVDTSALFEELRAKYQRSGKQVQVDFRKLINWIRLGDQLTHQIHPYPAKLLPNIAHFFAHAASLQGLKKIVLDPFCGSGTVALEASLAGNTALVADANPLALLITKVKTTPYDPINLRAATHRILRRAARFKTAPELHIVNERLWYSETHKKALQILSRAVMELENQSEREFFLLCLSVTARRLSLADPAISVPVRLRTKTRFSRSANRRIELHIEKINSATASIEFSRVCEANICRVEQTNVMFKQRKAAVEVGNDARMLLSPNGGCEPLRSNSIPLIITSPPYGSAQKYIRASSLSLNWLGLARPDELANLEGKSIGREHVPLYREKPVEGSLPDSYERLLLRIKAKNRTREIITRQYLHEIRTAVQEMARVTARGGRIVVVIGNNQVCGESLRNDDFITGVLKECGLAVELRLIDHIKSRGLMTKRNKTASLISRECVSVFRKPL